MRTHTRVLLAALTAALVLGSAVSANARRIELSNQSFRVVWTGANNLTFSGGGAQVICEVTLEGSFHSRTLSKVCGQLVGYVTRAIVKHPCPTNEGWALNGTEVLEGVRVANTLPWHIQYQSFGGVLPRIRSVTVTLVGAAFLVEVLGLHCLYRSTQTNPQKGIVNVNETNGQVETLTSEPNPNVKLNSGAFCPAEGGLSGTGSVTVQNSTTRITIRLVQ